MFKIAFKIETSYILNNCSRIRGMRRSGDSTVSFFSRTSVCAFLILYLILYLKQRGPLRLAMRVRFTEGAHCKTKWNKRTNVPLFLSADKRSAISG